MSAFDLFACKAMIRHLGKLVSSGHQLIHSYMTGGELGQTHFIWTRTLFLFFGIRTNTPAIPVATRMIPFSLVCAGPVCKWENHDFKFKMFEMREKSKMFLSKIEPNRTDNTLYSSTSQCLHLCTLQNIFQDTNWTFPAASKTQHNQIAQNHIISTSPNFNLNPAMNVSGVVVECRTLTKLVNQFKCVCTREKKKLRQKFCYKCMW